MKNILKNKKVLIGGVVVLILAILIVGVSLVLSKFGSFNSANEEIEALPTQIPIPTISAQAIGLKLVTEVPGKVVVASIENVEGITNISYEFSYTAKGDIPRGVFGEINVNKKPYQSRIDLGTCSAGKCKYDEEVSNIKIVLKITKDDGKVYQSEATLETTE